MKIKDLPKVEGHRKRLRERFLQDSRKGVADGGPLMFPLKEQFKSFLEANKFLPLSEWSSFELDHGDPTIYKENRIKIKREVAGKSGLYIYQKDGKVLYIGKGNPLFNRLKSHNRESFEPVPGDTKDNMRRKKGVRSLLFLF